MRAHLQAVALLAAACGDNGGSRSDAPASDAFAPPDAVACEPGAVPYEDRSAGILDVGIAVTLDGIGTHCEQLARAVTDPAVLPAEYTPTLAYDLTAQCSASEGGYEDVTFRGIGYGGVPTLDSQELGVLFVGLRDLTITYFITVYFPPDRIPAPSCLGATELQLQLPGVAIPYVSYDEQCSSEEQAYVAAPGDAFLVGDELLYVDGGFLHRIRSVDVRLLPSHVTEAMLESDMYCCEAPSLVDCVGTQVYVDTFTREVLRRVPACDHVCAPAS